MPEGRHDERPQPSRAACTSAFPVMDETAGEFLYERKNGAPSPTPQRTPTYLNRPPTYSPHARRPEAQHFRLPGLRSTSPRPLARCTLGAGCPGTLPEAGSSEAER